MRNLALHWKIMIGMVLGIIFGLLMTNVTGGGDIVSDWIAPVGTIFVNLLKMIAIPLIIVSLIKGELIRLSNLLLDGGTLRMICSNCLLLYYLYRLSNVTHILNLVYLYTVLYLIYLKINLLFIF